MDDISYQCLVFASSERVPYLTLSFTADLLQAFISDICCNNVTPTVTRKQIHTSNLISIVILVMDILIRLLLLRLSVEWQKGKWFAALKDFSCFLFPIILGILAVKPEEFHWLTSVDLAFRHSRGEDEIATRKNQRSLKVADIKRMNTEKKLPEAVNNTFDPNPSSRRSFKRT
ncbi:hypothetical protein V6N12_049994 [Hibiscus sabdariffa]|uniref:Uncharacterized protein n=1 Tax=Hibiscus sabdariffa TaxID=183260 RepID=A0ABR2GCA9_9ROSI